MKKKLGTLFLSALLVCTFALAACGGERGGKTEFTYPDAERTPETVEKSWEYGDKSDLTIEWYVDSSTFAYSGIKENAFTEEIYKQTGIKIKFTTPVSDDGTMLNSLITGGKLPDLVSVAANATTYNNMALNGYVYPLQELAARWAPHMFDHIDNEIVDFYSVGENFFGIPNLFYTDENLREVEAQGTSLGSNGGIFVRRDYLDWYTSEYPNADPTTQDGFVEMCKAVKQKYKITNDVSTVLLAQFNSQTNQAIRWLAQYFAAPLEDKSGNLMYLEEQPQYLEALKFLNRLYREKLISDANFTDNSSAISTHVQNGRPFCFMGTPQTYQSAFRVAYKNGVEYVPIVFTNLAGDAPMLQDLSGVGARITMVSTNCKNPDRVIKLMDYLTSDEGQLRLMSGVEGEYFNYTVKPGETKDGKTYEYGLIEWTEPIMKDVANFDFDKYGLWNLNLLNINRCGYILSLGGLDSHVTLTDYVTTNMKAPLANYTYSFKDMNFPIDASDSRYKAILTKENNCTKLWIEKAAEIIQAQSEAACEEEYNVVLKRVKAYGSDDVLAFKNEYFKKYKEKRGIEFAYPANKAGWTKPEIALRGDPSKTFEIPAILLAA